MSKPPFCPSPPSTPLFPDENGIEVLLPQVMVTKNLGDTVQSTLSPRAQVNAAVAKARSMLAFMRRTFKRLSPEIFLPVYSALVRPPLEYCVQAWSPNSARDIDAIEKVQEIATRNIPGFSRLSYIERLRNLKLFSLRRRRLRGDLIETFKTINGVVSVNTDDFFAFRRSKNQVGIPSLLPSHECSHPSASRRSQSVINSWNLLPTEKCHASDIRFSARGCVSTDESRPSQSRHLFSPDVLQYREKSYFIMQMSIFCSLYISRVYFFFFLTIFFHLAAALTYMAWIFPI